MLFVVLCPGTPEGSTGSGSGFKASQKTGQRLKVSSDRLGEAGNQNSRWHFMAQKLNVLIEFSLYPATLKSAGYYVIPSIQKIGLERPSVSASFHSLLGAFFDQFSSNLL